MTPIFAAEPASSTCPSFCEAHLPTADGDVVHISPERVIELAEGRVYVSIEQAPDTPPSVRLQGAYDVPMTPAQTLHLAALLTASAFTAATTWQVTQ